MNFVPVAQLWSLVVVLGLSSWGAAESAFALTLEDAFQAALARSEVVGIQRELLFQQDELYSQAKGSLLPSVSALGSELWQETPTSSVGSSLSPAVQPLAKITAQQPLFRGFREFAGIRQARELVAAQDEAWKAAAIQLYKDLATSFYSVLALEGELSDIREEIGLYERRLKDLDARVRIGRSRVSEVLTVQALRANLAAQAESLAGQVSTQRALLSFLTGLAGDYSLEDKEQIPSGALDFAAYLALAGNRPDVRADERRVASAEEGVSVARGAHLPSADLYGNYYLTRSGSLRDVSWDIQLVLSLPLYQGGVLQSRVHQAESQKTQADLIASRTRRLAETEIRQAFEQFKYDRKQLQAYTDALELSRKNYQEQTKEYRLGLVTNLDVLQAMTTFEESQRSLNRVRAFVKLDFARLEASVARRPSPSLLETKR